MHGVNLLFDAQLSKPMPFVGAVGSFDELDNNDIYLRFYDFYDIFFDTLDIAIAYSALQKANPDMLSKYRYIPADELFYKAYHDYLIRECTPEAIRARVKKTMKEMMQGKFLNRQQRIQKECEFIRKEQKSRFRYYQEHSSLFFMLKEYLEDRDRFDVPKTF